MKLGVAAKLTDVLDAAGVAYEVFDQVPPDSSMDVVNEVARLYTERGCDGFVAIGGGSVIDTTKGAAASLACEGVDFATLQGSEILKADLPPLIAVPTTAGTGSEVTLVAVVADTHKHAKLSFTSYKLVPHAAILDPALTSSLPPKLTATTGMDALTHAVEAYTSIQKNPVSDAFAVKAIELIAENLPVACREGANVDARTSLALGSLLAGAAFSNAMVGIVHALGHSLGGLCHIPHGQAMMMLLPHCVRFNLDRGIHAGLYGELLDAPGARPRGRLGSGRVHRGARQWRSASDLFELERPVPRPVRRAAHAVRAGRDARGPARRGQAGPLRRRRALQRDGDHAGGRPRDPGSDVLRKRRSVP